MNASRFPIVTTTLIVVNVLVYILLEFMFPQFYDAGVLSVRSALNGQWWAFFTSMFMHGGLMHLACNMISLFYLGTMIEEVFGKGKFLLIYMVSGLVGGVVYVLVNAALKDFTGAVGASGAIFGLFGAYGLLLFRERKTATIFVRPTSGNEVRSYLIFLAINIGIGFTVPGIANEAHIGGLLCGCLMAAMMYPSLARRFRSYM